MNTKHVLQVDGYVATSEERMFEGVMFQVHITETSDDLVIDDVTTLPADAAYLKKFRMEPFLAEVRTHVQKNIDHLKWLANDRGTTLTAILDQDEIDNPGEPRIDILNEV
jgi:hypothetical protein